MTLKWVTSQNERRHICDVAHNQRHHLVPSIPATTSRSNVWHDTCMCNMTHSRWTWLAHLWLDSSICDMHQNVLLPWNDSSMCAMTHSHWTWLIHLWHDSSICDMTHKSSICDMKCAAALETWLIHVQHDSFDPFTCDMTHPFVTWLKVCCCLRTLISAIPSRSYVWHNSFKCDVTRPWLIHMW